MDTRNTRTKPPARSRGGRPQFRACYGPHIKEILRTIPASLAVNNLNMTRTISFLDKLADYLMSDEYAQKSAKAISKKAAWANQQSNKADKKA